MSISKAFLFILSWTSNFFGRSAYSIDELSQNFFDSNQPLVHDPQALLAPDTIQKMENDLRSKEGLRKYSIRFCVVSAIDFVGEDGKTKVNFDMWVEQYVQRILFDDREFDSNLMLFYSIGDRKWRLRTGEKVLEIFKDRTLDRIAKSIQSELKSKHYDKAFLSLIERLADKEEYEGWQFSDFFVIFFVLALGLIAAFVGYQVWKDSKSEKIKKIFRTYKEIEKEGKDFKIFTQESCVVCLEKLVDRKNEGESSSKPDGGRPNQEIEDDRADREGVLLPELQDSELEKIIRETGESVYLPCGHNFHRQCIEATLKVSKKCPICRNEVRIRDFSSFRGPFLDFHRRAHGRIFRPAEIDDFFANPTRRVHSTSSTGRTNRVSYRGFRSGGSSGGW